MLIEIRFHTFHTAYYGGGFIQSAFGVAPLFVRAALSTITFVFVGVLIAPTSARTVAFVFFALSLAFSVGELGLFEDQADEILPFWLACAAGFVLGALLGLSASIGLQDLRKSALGRDPIIGFFDGISVCLIGRRPVTQRLARTGVRFMRMYLEDHHFVDPDKLREQVLIALWTEACRRAGDEEEDKVPRIRSYHRCMREVAAEAAAASRGEISAPTRVRSLLEFHGMI